MTPLTTQERCHGINFPINHEDPDIDEDIEQALAILIAGLYNYWHIHSQMDRLHANLATGQRAAYAWARRTNTHEAWARAALFDRWQGDWALQRGHFAAAERSYQASLTVCHNQDDARGATDSRLNLAILARQQGDIERADAEFTALAHTYAQQDDWQGEEIAWFELGLLHLLQGRQHQGRAALKRVQTILRAHGHKQDERATLLFRMGIAFLSQNWRALGPTLQALDAAVTRTQARALLGIMKFIEGLQAYRHWNYRRAIRLWSEGISAAEAMEQTPLVAQMRFRRSLAYLVCGRFAASERDLRACLQLLDHPGSAPVARVEATIVLSFVLAVQDLLRPAMRTAPYAPQKQTRGRSTGSTFSATAAQTSPSMQDEAANVMQEALSWLQMNPTVRPFNSRLATPLLRMAIAYRARHTRRTRNAAVPTDPAEHDAAK